MNTCKARAKSRDGPINQNQNVLKKFIKQASLES